jgi:DNA-binding MarR family transcriptional regulator
MRRRDHTAERYRRHSLAMALKPLSHPMRLLFLEEFLQRGEMSPVGLARALSEDFALTAKYVTSHLRPMETAGLLEMTRTGKVRGATEHFYALTSLGTAIAKAVRDVPTRY